MAEACPFGCDLPWPHRAGQACCYIIAEADFDAVMATFENPLTPTQAVIDGSLLIEKLRAQRDAGQAR